MCNKCVLLFTVSKLHATSWLPQAIKLSGKKILQGQEKVMELLLYFNSMKIDNFKKHLHLLVSPVEPVARSH